MERGWELMKRVNVTVVISVTPSKKGVPGKSGEGKDKKERGLGN